MKRSEDYYAGHREAIIQVIKLLMQEKNVDEKTIYKIRLMLWGE